MKILFAVASLSGLGVTGKPMGNWLYALKGTAKAVPSLVQTALVDKSAISDSAPPWHDHVGVDLRLETGQPAQSALSERKSFWSFCQRHSSLFPCLANTR